ncbi:PQQ-binding-like beta-propeller repeat protein [Salinicoccus albus]|uniref:outer membrane protein assembly factor BamB family protein n=1 Tax=Salinicoccus albus TaxID=418756 RepID=UPI00036BA66B|nr:PQQ-binding-like beta-propeller repeat protein [Salinicoccus albus]
MGRILSAAAVILMLMAVSACEEDTASNESIENIDTYGAEEWSQYRLQPDKNAVIDTGDAPLSYMELETEEEVRATPVVADGKLFAGNHNSGDLMAFDLATGERVWENQAPNWVHSESIYHEGTVYVGYGNRNFRESGIRGTGDNGILAIDAQSGETLWQFETEGEVMPTPAVYENHLYVATGDTHLYKLTLDEGELVHRYELGSVVSMSAPNIHEDTLYVGGSAPKPYTEPYTFYAYDLRTDKIKWETHLPEVAMGLDDVPPAVHDGIAVTTALVINAQGESEHEIYALDTDTGKVIWQDNWGSGALVQNNKSGAPMIHEDKVFVASPKTETYYAYDLESGEQLWAYEDEAAKAPPVAQDGIVYYSNAAGAVAGIDIESGEKVREKELGGALAPSGPIIVNDTLIVGSQDHNVYVVPLSDFDEVNET